MFTGKGPLVRPIFTITRMITLGSGSQGPCVHHSSVAESSGQGR